ncbi:MAG: UDP-2,3-diacylglucosamine diphosphatase [Porticoccaceae bacterium]|nr:UDP-2,3-diacylglucosamine diphosphatase [Porticoccaceae bacterium]
MSILFISDLHLSPQRPAVTRAFLLFLQQQAVTAEALYVLGDLFEAWVGDDDNSPLSIEIQQAFKELTERGIALYIQHGNRDFLLGRRFMSNTGATLLADEYIVDYQGQRALLMHGDTLCIDDIDYLRFRRKVRNPLCKFCFGLLPLKRRQRLASDWRAKSMAANANKPSAIMDVNAEAVDAVMEKYQIGTLIHGHTHRPNRHQVSAGERIVLGDWHDHGWVLQLDRSGFELQSFAI